MERTRTAPSPRAAQDASQGWVDAVIEVLDAYRVEMVAYVPDEVAGHLLDRLHADPARTVVCCTREEEAVAVLAGGYLGGKRGALIAQTSGIGNALNALGSLVVPYQIPMLLIISERGGLGEFNPAQVPFGHAVPRVLDALGIQTCMLVSAEEIPAVLGAAAELSFSTRMPVGAVLSTLLTGGKTLK